MSAERQKYYCLCGKKLKKWTVAELIDFYGDVNSVACSHCFKDLSKWRHADKLLFICDLPDGYHEYHTLGYGLCYNCIQSIDHNAEIDQISNSTNDHAIIYLRLLNSFKLISTPHDNKSYDFDDILSLISKQLKQITEYEGYLNETQITELIKILNDSLAAFLDQTFCKDFSIFEFVRWHDRNACKLKPDKEPKESINSYKIDVETILAHNVIKYFQQNIISHIEQEITSESWQKACDSVAAFGFCLYQLQKQHDKVLSNQQMASLLQKYQELKTIIIEHIDRSVLCVCNNLLLTIQVKHWRRISSHTYSYNFCYLCCKEIELYDDDDLQIFCCEVDDSSTCHKNGFLVCNKCISTINNTNKISVSERSECILTASLSKLIEELAKDGDSKNIRAKFKYFEKSMSIFESKIDTNKYNILQNTQQDAMNRYIPLCNCGERLYFTVLHKERCRCKHCFEICELNQTVYECSSGKNCILESLGIPWSPRKPFEFNIENDDRCGCGCVTRVNPKWYYIHTKCGANLTQNNITIDEEKDNIQYENSKITRFNCMGDRIMYRLNCSLLSLKERCKQLSNRTELFDFAVSCHMFSYHLFLCQQATKPSSLCKPKKRKNRYRGRLQLGRLRAPFGSESDDEQEQDDTSNNDVNKIQEIVLNKHKLSLMKQELNKMIQQIKGKIPRCECGEVYITQKVDMSYDVDFDVCIYCYAELQKCDIGYVCKAENCSYKPQTSRWGRSSNSLPKYLCRNCIDKNLIIGGDCNSIIYQRLCSSLNLLKAHIDAVGGVKSWINASNNLRYFFQRSMKFDLNAEQKLNLREELKKFNALVKPHVPVCVCGRNMIVKKYGEFSDVCCKLCFLPIKYADFALGCAKVKECKRKEVGYYFHDKCYKEALHCKFMNSSIDKRLKFELDAAMTNVESQYDDKNNDDKQNNMIVIKCINMEKYIDEILQKLLKLNVKEIREQFYSLKSPPKTDEIDYEITETILLKDLYTIIKNNSIVISNISMKYPQIIPQSKLIKINNDWVSGLFIDKTPIEIINDKIENAQSVTFRVESKGFKFGYHLQIILSNKDQCSVLTEFEKKIKESMKEFAPWSIELYNIYNKNADNQIAIKGFIECNHCFIIASNWMNTVEIFLPHSIVSLIALYFSKELPSEIEVQSWLEKICESPQIFNAIDTEFILNVMKYKRDRRFISW